MRHKTLGSQGSKRRLGGGGGGVPGASWSPIWPPSRDVFAMEPGANVIEPESPENVI